MPHYFSTRNTNIPLKDHGIKSRNTSSSFLKSSSSGRKSIENSFNSQDIYQDGDNQHNIISTKLSSYFPTIKGNKQSKSKSARSLFGKFQRSLATSVSYTTPENFDYDCENNNSTAKTMQDNKGKKAHDYKQKGSEANSIHNKANDPSFEDYMGENPEVFEVVNHLIEASEEELADIENAYKGPSCYFYKNNTYMNSTDHLVDITGKHKHISPVQFQNLVRSGVSMMEFDMLLQQYTLIWDELNGIKSKQR